MRAHATIAALALCACAKSPDAWTDTTPAGFVAAPTIAASATPPLDGSVTKSAEAPARARRVPPEPEPEIPPEFGRCEPDTTCRDAEAAPLGELDPPFDRCPAANPRAPDAKLSARATLAARRAEPRTCCYVVFHCEVRFH